MERRTFLRGAVAAVAAWTVSFTPLRRFVVKPHLEGIYSDDYGDAY